MADRDALINLRVQVNWEDALQVFFEKMDHLGKNMGLSDPELITLVRNQIDDETADRYKEWISEE